jgi:hypothetical protein
MWLGDTVGGSLRVLARRRQDSRVRLLNWLAAGRPAFLCGVGPEAATTIMHGPLALVSNVGAATGDFAALALRPIEPANTPQ